MFLTVSIKKLCTEMVYWILFVFFHLISMRIKEYFLWRTALPIVESILDIQIILKFSRVKDLVECV